MSKGEQRFVKSLFGRSAIGGRTGLAFLFLHLIHLVLIFITGFLNPMIYYCCWSKFFPYSVPLCRFSRCAFSNRIVTLDLLRSIVLDALRCNRDSNASVDLSLKMLHFPLWRLTIWQSSSFWSFVATYFWLLWNIRGALVMSQSNRNLFCWVDLICFESSPLLCTETHAVGNEVSNSVVSSPVKHLI